MSLPGTHGMPGRATVSTVLCLLVRCPGSEATDLAYEASERALVWCTARQDPRQIELCRSTGLDLSRTVGTVAQLSHKCMVYMGLELCAQLGRIA